jgi:hypothetical protein
MIVVTIQRQLKVSKERLLYSDSLIGMVHQGNVLNKTADFYYYGRIDCKMEFFFNNSAAVSMK